MTESTISATSRFSVAKEPVPVYDVLETHRGGFWGQPGYLIWPDGSQMASWEKEDGSLDPNPPGAPPIGPVMPAPYPGYTPLYEGFQVLAGAIVNLDLVAAYSGVLFGPMPVTVCIRQNGTIIGTFYRLAFPDAAGSPAIIALTDVVAAAGDVFTVSALAPDWPLFAFGSVSYVWNLTHFKITGLTLETARKWLRGHVTFAAEMGGGR